MFSRFSTTYSSQLKAIVFLVMLAVAACDTPFHLSQTLSHHSVINTIVDHDDKENSSCDLDMLSSLDYSCVAIALFGLLIVIVVTSPASISWYFLRRNVSRQSSRKLHLIDSRFLE